MSWDAIVVGGGLAGAAVACRLAQAGQRTLVLERERGPHHKVCGEFLSVEAVKDLDGLGLDPYDLGAVPVTAVRLIEGRQVARTELPFRALGLSRRILDEALLAHAAAAGATVRRGVQVQRIARADGAWQVEGERAPALFLASGKHEVRGFPRRPAARNNLIGFKMPFRVSPQAEALLDGHVDVLLYDGGYAGLQRVEDGVANLCLLVDRDRFSVLGRRWDTLLRHLHETVPHLAACLDGGVPCLAKPLAIAAIPYGYLHDPKQAPQPDGLYRLGDQAAVIPSFAGDGMAIALHSAHAAAAAHLNGDGAQTYHETLHGVLRAQIRTAALVARSAETRFGRRLLVQACRMIPPIMAKVARQTRIPSPQAS